MSESKNSKAKITAVSKYNAQNYEEIKLRVKKGEKNQIKNHATKYDNGSVNSFIKRAIDETMERDTKKG